MSTLNSPSQSVTTAYSQKHLTGLQARVKLVIGAVPIAFLAVLLMSQVFSTYSSAYDLFQNVVDNNATKVNASEEALQKIAVVDKYLADFIGKASKGTIDGETLAN